MPVKCQPLRKGTYTISSGFRPANRPDHNGTDFAAKLGVPIYAVADGIIIEGKDRKAGSVSGFGNWIWQDSQKEFSKDFIYGHMRHQDILVQKGDRVKAGQLIAHVGSEGQSSGPHLHFEVWNPPGRVGGVPIDPMAWLVGAIDPDPTAVAPKLKGPVVGDPVWLPDVLRAEGLVCDIFPGAFARGHGDFGEIWGVVGHHTGDEPPYDSGPGGIANHPSLGLCSQLYLSRSGKFTLCGVGLAWHAGNGYWPGVGRDAANNKCIGIEADNSGTEGWNPVQLDAYQRGVGAILRHLGHDSSHFIGHREWYYGRKIGTDEARRGGGKWDPGGIDLDVFRAIVQNIILRKGDDDMTKEQEALLRDVQTQLRGPDLKGWPQLGKNNKGESLTLVDAVAQSLNQQAAIQKQQEEILALLRALKG